MQIIDLIIDQGADFSVNLALNDVNGNPIVTSAYTAVAGMRKSYASEAFIPFGVSLSNGNINLTLSGANSAMLQYGRYVWDISLTSSANTILRPVGGRVFMTPGVSSQANNWSNQPDDGSGGGYVKPDVIFIDVQPSPESVIALTNTQFGVIAHTQFANTISYQWGYYLNNVFTALSDGQPFGGSTQVTGSQTSNVALSNVALGLNNTTIACVLSSPQALNVQTQKVLLTTYQ